METKSATKRQLFALWLASGKSHDYRNDNLTMEQASQMISEFNEKRTKEQYTKVKKITKGKKLEGEFIDYVTNHFGGIVSIAKKALNINSVVEDDPTIFTDEKKRNRYNFVGFGCGISVIQFDKRSKIGMQIKELSSKHWNDTFLKLFLSNFTTEQIEYYKNIGCPLSAIYCQDIRIGGVYENIVANFMRAKGVKNVQVKTYYD